MNNINLISSILPTLVSYIQYNPWSKYKYTIQLIIFIYHFNIIFNYFQTGIYIYIW